MLENSVSLLFKHKRASSLGAKLGVRQQNKWY